MRNRVLVLVAAVGVTASGAGAQEATPPPGPGPDSGPTLHGKLALSLADAVKMALENNLDVEVQRHEPLIREQDRKSAWGTYDPVLFAEGGWEDDRSPNSFGLNAASVTQVRTGDGNAGFRGILPLVGLEYSASLVTQRVDTNNTIQRLSPEFRTTVDLSARLPLLKDLIWNEPWTRVKTTRLVHLSALEQFRSDVMDVVRSVEDAYWSLIAADDAVRVARKSLETAEALLEQTRTQYDVGVVSKVEVVEAEAGVAERELNRIQAQNAYENQQDVLIDLVLGTGLRAESNLQIEPADRPEDFVPFEIDVPEAVELAFQNRPELAVAEREIERGEIQLKFAKNQWLPEFDVEVGYRHQDLAGDANNNFGFGAAQSIGNYDKSYDDLFDYDTARGWRFRGFFSIPIPNRTASAEKSKAKLELRRSRVSKRRVEQGIILEVRSAARDLESSQEQIEAAEKRRLAAEEQLRAERIRLEYGESTPFDVLDRERDLVDAESQKIRAFQEYRTSRTSLDRAQGTILRNRNIAIDAVLPLR